MAERQPKTFNNLAPDKDITDPDGLAVNRDYPAHVHYEDGSYLVVNNDDEKAAALAAGYTLEPTHEQWTNWGKKPIVPLPKTKGKSK